jgi:hypothetical protein
MKPSKILAAVLSALLLATPALLGGSALLYVGIFAALAAIIATTAGQGGTDVITPSTTGTGA